VDCSVGLQGTNGKSYSSPCNTKKTEIQSGTQQLDMLISMMSELLFSKLGFLDGLYWTKYWYSRLVGNQEDEANF
jgi:hypothetical protein